ncbi:hypothetical protein AGMMS50229_07010 [Campylobacterota bacterium]|nr:hypothetical protein AGMMS50229_07010 [Campylobacterota bacterium]
MPLNAPIFGYHRRNGKMKRELSQTVKTEIGKYFLLPSVATYAGGALTQMIDPSSKSATIIAAFVLVMLLFMCGYYFLKDTK